jgi:aromatic ring-cleaving dioxygenase
MKGPNLIISFRKAQIFGLMVFHKTLSLLIHPHFSQDRLSSLDFAGFIELN